MDAPRHTWLVNYTDGSFRLGARWQASGEVVPAAVTLPPVLAAIVLLFSPVALVALIGLFVLGSRAAAKILLERRRRDQVEVLGDQAHLVSGWPWSERHERFAWSSMGNVSIDHDDILLDGATRIAFGRKLAPETRRYIAGILAAKIDAAAAARKRSVYRD